MFLPKADVVTDKAAFSADRYHSGAYKLLSNAFSLPITFLRRSVKGPDGEEIGTFATSTVEIDQILTSAWQNIYQGTARPLQSVVAGFASKYQQYILQQPEHAIDDINPDTPPNPSSGAPGGASRCSGSGPAPGTPIQKSSVASPPPSRARSKPPTVQLLPL